jgi:hypothetical protein
MFGVAVLACGGVLTLMLSRFHYLDPEWEPAPPPDPRHLGHRDVLVVDSVDRVVSGHLVEDYEGRWSKDARWEGRRRAVAEEIPSAIQDVRARLGLGDRPEPPFVVRFRDDAQMGFGIFMSTYQEIRSGEVRPLIVVGVDSLLSGECDYREALRHEIAHCWHLADLGRSFYMVPSWVKEGLADWASGGGENRLLRLYQRDYHDPIPYADAGNDPARRIVNGLGGAHTADDYAEDYLAFAYVEKSLGIASVHRLVAELFADTPYPVAFQRATGKPFPTFEEEARRWATERVQGDLSRRWAYFKAKQAFQKEQFLKAEAAYGAYLDEEGFLPYRALAMVERAECHLELGDVAAARTLLAAAESTAPLGFYNARILRDRVRISVAGEDWKSAHSNALAYLADYEHLYQGYTSQVRSLLAKAQAKLPPPPGKPKAAPAPAPSGASTGSE